MTATLRLADPEQGMLDDVVDLARYGLDDRVASWAALGRRVGKDLRRVGISRLPGFVRPDAAQGIADELDRLEPYAAIRADRRSVYGRTLDPLEYVPESEWLAGHVTRDMIVAHSPAHRLYVSPLFKALVASCVGTERVYEYADPLAGLIATVVPPGGCYGWHYDTNEYVVTIAIRDAEQGGELDYHRDLRRPNDENLDGLRAVLDGRDPTPPRTVRSQPGDLQVFLGRYSLHRVRTVLGSRSRLTLVLSYAERPGVIGPVDRTRAVYGRVTEAHLVAAATMGADGLIL